jgi:hypothetical protein
MPRGVDALLLAWISDTKLAFGYRIRNPGAMGATTSGAGSATVTRSAPTDLLYEHDLLRKEPTAWPHVSR